MPNDIADWTSSTLANVAPSVQATTISLIGQPVVSLPDTSIFSIGDVVNVTAGLVGGPAGASTLSFVKAINPDVSITLTANLAGQVSVGDVVQRLPVIGIFGQPIGVSSRQRAWNSTGFSSPGDNGQASVVFAALPGQFYLLNHIVATLASNAAAGALLIGLAAFDSATLVYFQLTGSQAIVGHVDRVNEENMALKGTAGNSLTVQFQAVPGVNHSETVFAAVYINTTDPV